MQSSTFIKRRNLRLIQGIFIKFISLVKDFTLIQIMSVDVIVVLYRVIKDGWFA